MQNSVLDWLDKTAERMPDKLAICDENGELTYCQYRNKSLALAREIICIKRQLGIERKVPVVVYLEKGKEVLVSFMGIAYSGSFYSPIDVDMPESRMSKIMEILLPQIIITTRKLKKCSLIWIIAENT